MSSQENQITVRGYVTSEPKFWQTRTTRTPVAEIRIGSTPRRLNRATGEWQDADTTYYTVKCWRRLAVNVASSLRKGDMVIVRGRFAARRWVDDQQRPRVQIEVEADTVGHDLLFGWAHFIRGVQAPPARSERDAAGDGIVRDGIAGDDVASELDQYDMAVSAGAPVSPGGPGAAPGDLADHDDRDERDDHDGCDDCDDCSDRGTRGDGDGLAASDADALAGILGASADVAPVF